MSAQNTIRVYLQEGLDELGIQVPEHVLEKLEAYQRVLSKWNKTINLTAHRSDKDSIEKNFLDSIYLSQHVRENRILDFGSGAGFPGLVLALLNPQRCLFLIEADQKKTSFLKSTIISLSIKNAEVINRYVDIKKSDEDNGLPADIDLIVSRATISSQDLIQFSSHHLKAAGRLALMLSEKQILEIGKEIDRVYEKDLEIKYTLPWSKTDRYLFFLIKK